MRYAALRNRGGYDMIAALLLSLLIGCATPGTPTMWLAAPVGVRAPDAIDGRPGNPFATAFIELLADPRLTLGEFALRLRARTAALSHGLLEPEIASPRTGATVRLGDPAASLRRIALVVIHAQYSDGLPPLAGAAHDAGRVSAALRRAGFETETLVDPGRTARQSALRRFAQASHAADVALIYVTGHGMMSGGEGYLLDSDFSLGWRDEAIQAHALAISSLGAGLAARRANVVLFGGCRSYEWWD